MWWLWIWQRRKCPCSRVQATRNPLLRRIQRRKSSRLAISRWIKHRREAGTRPYRNISLFFLWCVLSILHTLFPAKKLKFCKCKNYDKIHLTSCRYVRTFRSNPLFDESSLKKYLYLFLILLHICCYISDTRNSFSIAIQMLAKLRKTE